jgi:hypothetical protein
MSKKLAYGRIVCLTNKTQITNGRKYWDKVGSKWENKIKEFKHKNLYVEGTLRPTARYHILSNSMNPVIRKYRATGNGLQACRSSVFLVMTSRCLKCQPNILPPSTGWKQWVQDVTNVGCVTQRLVVTRKGEEIKPNWSNRNSDQEAVRNPFSETL